MAENIKMGSVSKGRMTKSKGIPTKEKIEIFERFKTTGQKITGKTIFEGHPIGHWAIQIRNEYYNSSSRKFSDEIIEKLIETGVLERQVDSFIDEKIKYLADWNAKYPRALVSSDDIPEEILKDYAKSDEEAQKLLKQHEQMRRHYIYINQRRQRGKLTEEQLKNCKEANIRGVFGYSTAIENMAKKYRIDEDKIIYILDKYKTMENFSSAYRAGKLSQSDIEILSSNLKKCLDIRLSDNQNYDIFIDQIMGTKTPYITDETLNFYDSNTIQGILATVPKKQRTVLIERFRIRRWKKKNITKG